MPKEYSKFKCRREQPRLRNPLDRRHSVAVEPSFPLTLTLSRGERLPRMLCAHCAPEPTPGPSQEGSYTGWPIPLLGGVRGGPVPLLGGVRGGPVPLLGGVRGGLVGTRFMGRERRFGFRGFSFLSSFAIRHSDFR